MYVNQGTISWALNVLKNMIAIPTVNPPGANYEKFVNYISNIIRELGAEVEVIEVPKDLVGTLCNECKDYPRYIVIGRIGNGNPIVQFNGHYDVVPPGEGWSLNPFEGRVVDGKIYGRGAVDMKGGIASILLAVRAFVDLYKDFRGTIEIALVPDEEMGGETGTGYLLRSLRRSPNYAIIAEGSGSTNIWIGHRGVLWGYIEIIGVQSHGATPWRGVNAFEYMAKVALRLLELHKEVVFKRISKYNYGDPNGVRPTITLGGEVKGSTKINIVPGYYAFSFDRRIIPEESLELVEKELRDMINQVAKEHAEVEIRSKIVNRVKPALTEEDRFLVKVFESTIERVLAVKPRKIVCLGALDMHYYTEKGIETVSYGPGPEDRAHVVDEYVYLDEIVRVANVYVNALARLLNGMVGTPIS